MINYNIIPLGELLNKEYDETKLKKAFEKFSCQRELDLENFLRYKAITYDKTNYGKTYLIIDSDKLRDESEFCVVAYFTIAQKSLDVSAISKKKKRKVLGEYPGRDGLGSVPTYLIGQLGRCDDYTSEDLSGEQILNECYHSISIAAQIVGGNIIVLECRECMYAKFYEGQHFKKLYDDLNDENLYTLYKKVDFQEYWNRKSDPKPKE